MLAVKQEPNGFGADSLDEPNIFDFFYFRGRLFAAKTTRMYECSVFMRGRIINTVRKSAYSVSYNYPF